jgi:hypothetical protein
MVRNSTNATVAMNEAASAMRGPVAAICRPNVPTALMTVMAFLSGFKAATPLRLYAFREL